ncbi:uncharacterized protein [Dermacentor andersoni]|uniref:uncharacterized protein n=1 Tax=Dermacentor andersoni TaxID=34620 RepID=UPI0021558C6D|nr:uncharacterized protein LOC126516592 [Dermacentor andersoni]
MAIRRKKPGQPARLSDQPVHQYSKAHRVCKVNSSNPAVRNLISTTTMTTATRLPRQHQDRRSDGTEATSSKCFAGPTGPTTSSCSELPSAATHGGGDENRSDNAALPQCKDGNSRTGEGTCAEGDGSAQEDGVRRLQNRLRDNWSKLVTDRITMMAFARSLKGHKCPTVLYCQS